MQLIGFVGAADQVMQSNVFVVSVAQIDVVFDVSQRIADQRVVHLEDTRQETKT